MPIEYVSGDLFVNRFHAEALAHGCNCHGSMGVGIATGFRDRYPEMYDEYRRRCKAKPREFNPGDVMLWKGTPSVFNLATQENYWRGRATYEAIEKALRGMRELAEHEGINSIAMPRIGAGYGGLSWNKVRAVIEAVFAGWMGTLYLYAEYRAEAEEPRRSIVVESRRRKRTSIEKGWPGALVIDVTSKGEEPWVRFSPFYPHGDIPVPNTPGTFAMSVEGLWQGLKVFENEDIDPSRWQIRDMNGIKRAGRKRGNVLGHRFGVNSHVLLGYRDARYQIYLPAYRWVLENKLVNEVVRLRQDAADRSLVLLDYETNGKNIEDLARPLSHAALIKGYLEVSWPSDGSSTAGA